VRCRRDTNKIEEVDGSDPSKDPEAL